MAKRDRHDVMTDPRALRLVGGSKSNSKISKKNLLYAELRNSPTGEFGAEVRGNSAERRHVGGFAMSRRPRASQPRPTIPPRSRRPARTRRPAARPAKSLLSVKTLQAGCRSVSEKIAISDYRGSRALSYSRIFSRIYIAQAALKTRIQPSNERYSGKLTVSGRRERRW